MLVLKGGEGGGFDCVLIAGASEVIVEILNLTVTSVDKVSGGLWLEIFNGT